MKYIVYYSHNKLMNKALSTAIGSLDSGNELKIYFNQETDYIEEHLKELNPKALIYESIGFDLSNELFVKKISDLNLSIPVFLLVREEVSIQKINIVKLPVKPIDLARTILDSVK